MNQSRFQGLPKWFPILVVALLCSIAGAYSDTLINIDPSDFPGSWYRLMLDLNGDYMSGEGDGYGETWYYYPATGWWRMWFYNQPFDPDREGYLYYRVFITANDYSRTASFSVYFNWTTPEWSALGYNRPPLPDDAPTWDDEAKYMDSTELQSLSDVFLGSPESPGSVEPNKSCRVRNYNPEWVSIDIQGRNIDVLRGVMRECRSKEGACCDHSSLDCFMAYEEDCPAPYEWLGSGTTCNDCTAQQLQLDFGDAPSSYGTTLANNGPRHLISSGIHLGDAIDSETDGKPSSDATGDDSSRTDDEDGVVFTSTLSPGEPASVEVTASAQGYLNAWMDFDGDGTFDGRDEQIFADVRLSTGVNSLTFNIPSTAVAGDTFARFRFNTRGLLAYYGQAQDGEVEDYKVSIVQGFDPQVNSGKGGLKWSQPAQSLDASTPFMLNGWDELSGLHLRQIAADDWQCSDEQPITGFQWWGSFDTWDKPMLPADQPLAFHIGIWTDAPGSAADSNHPDTLIWETYCTYWTWNVAGYEDDARGISQNETCFQFTCLLSQDQWFYPTLNLDAGGKTKPTVYWLSISAVYDTGTKTPEHPWGWTTRPHFFNNAAARITGATAGSSSVSQWPPEPASRWLAGDSVEYPRGTKWDLAFELLTNQGGECTGTSSNPSFSNPAPVFRFWSEQLATHFYTISEAERDYLIRDYAYVWTYEGIVFYAYPPETQAAGTTPVYRFWSNSLGRHYYTASESDKDDMIRNQSDVWAYEGVAWNAPAKATTGK
jgi:hypothetical protein